MNAARERLIERRVDGLINRRFPGMTVEIEDRYGKLRQERQVTIADAEIVAALKSEFEMNLLDERDEFPSNATDTAAVIAWLKKVTDYRDELEAMPGHELARLSEDMEKERREEFLKQQANSDLSQFFSESSAAADFEFWLKLSVWKPDECVALSLGKDPRKVNAETMHGFLRSSPFKNKYHTRTDILSRALKAGVISKPITPAKFLSWASTAPNFDLPPDLQTGDVRDVIAAAPDIDARLLKTFQKIIIGLAVHHYALNPEGRQVTKIGEIIKADLSSLGIDLSDRTIRKVLNAALDAAAPKGGGRQWVTKTNSKHPFLNAKW